MREKVYVASTDYDLLDARAEVVAFLQGMGYEVLYFESPGFWRRGQGHRHDVCLQAVKECDHLVVLIWRNAGAPYAGKEKRFRGSPITRCETQVAIERRLNIHWFVRDKVWEERAVFNKRSKETPYMPINVEASDAEKVFDFLNYLQRHARGFRVQTFSNTVDLKARLGTTFNPATAAITSAYNAGFVKAQQLDAILSKLYQEHRGNIWLFNNDLEVLKSEKLFEDLYVRIFYQSPKIRQVRLILSAEKFLDFFDPARGEEHKRLLRNFRKIRNRVKDFLIARLDSFDIPEYLSAPRFNWIFYTLDDELRDPNTVCLLRQQVPPFTLSTKELHSEDLLVICRTQDNSDFMLRSKNVFARYFRMDEKFRRLKLSVRANRATGFELGSS